MNLCEAVVSNCRCNREIGHAGAHECDCLGSWEFSENGEFIMLRAPQLITEGPYAGANIEAEPEKAAAAFFPWECLFGVPSWRMDFAIDVLFGYLDQAKGFFAPREPIRFVDVPSEISYE